MNRGITSLLLAISVLLAGLLAWQWIGPQAGLRGDTRWQPLVPIKPALESPSADAVALAGAGASQTVALLDRPVFAPSRRPPVPPAVAKAVAPAPPDPLDSAHLYGLFSGPTGGGVIVRVEGKTQRIGLAGSVGDWKLKTVRGREAVFARGAETRVISLVQVRQGGAGATPPPPQSAVTAPAPPPDATATVPPASSPTPGTPAARPSTAPPPASPFVIGGSRR